MFQRPTDLFGSCEAAKLPACDVGLHFVLFLLQVGGSQAVMLVFAFCRLHEKCII